MTSSRCMNRLLVVALLASLVSTFAFAGDPTDEPAAMIDKKYGGNIKKLFATRCSWCHQSYGMKQADGPRLAGTDKSVEQIMKQINIGKSPMPSFKSQLKQEEVQALAEFIKALPAN